MKEELPVQEVVIIIIQEKDKFLFQKNPKWNDLSFIGGKIDPTDSSPIEAAYRECGEELEIQRDTDYVLEPMDHYLYEEQKMSKRTGKVTHYKFYSFRMTIKKDISEKLNAEGNVWMKKEDISHPEATIKLSEIVQTVFPILEL